MVKASSLVVRDVFQGYADCEENWWLEKMKMKFLLRGRFSSEAAERSLCLQTKLIQLRANSFSKIEHLHPRDPPAMTRFCHLIEHHGDFSPRVARIANSCGRLRKFNYLRRSMDSSDSTRAMARCTQSTHL